MTTVRVVRNISGNQIGLVYKGEAAYVQRKHDKEPTFTTKVPYYTQYIELEWDDLLKVIEEIGTREIWR